MSAPLEGACPGCRQRGPVGQPCAERGCALRGTHFIPASDLAANQGHRPDPELGLLLDHRYLLVKPLGEGGFGRVFVALQQPLGMRVALKILKRDQDHDAHEARMRLFRLEAQAMAQLQHPNIVKIIDFGFFDGAAYLVMELVEGARTLKDELRRRDREGASLTLDEVESILMGVLSALEKAHSRKIIHRDVKPENIMLQVEPGHPVLPRLLDFGLAKFVDADTQSSAVLGTPSYMAPEQLTKADPGPWTDLYALGVVAFELMTGRRPFRGEVGQIVAEKRDPHFDVLSAVADLDVPDAIADFLRTALAFDVRVRFQSAQAFRVALHKALAAAADSPRADLHQIDVAQIAPTPTPRPLRPESPPAEAEPTLPQVGAPLDATPPRRAGAIGASASAGPLSHEPSPRGTWSSKAPLALTLAGLAVAGGIGFALLSPGAEPASTAASPDVLPSDASTIATADAPATPPDARSAAATEEGDADTAALLRAPPWEDASTLEAYCKRAMGRAQKARDVFREGHAGACSRPDARGRCEAVLALDHILRELDVASGVATVIQVGGISPAARNAAAWCNSDIGRFAMELASDPRIAETFSSLSELELSAPMRRFVDRTLSTVRNSGALEGPAAIAEIRTQLQGLAELDRRYLENFGRTNVVFTLSHPDHTRGVPPSVLATLPKDAQGHPQVSLDDGTAETLLAHAANPVVRRQLIEAMWARAWPDNGDIALDLLKGRARLATRLGHPNAAAGDLADKVMSSPEVVAAFLDETRAHLAPGVQADLAALDQEARRAGLAVPLAPQDRLFVLERSRQRLTPEPPDLAPFLRYAGVRDGLLARLGELLGLRITASSKPGWAPTVAVYDVFDKASDRELGAIFLDHQRRDGKAPGYLRVMPIQTGLRDTRPAWVAAFADLPTGDEAPLDLAQVSLLSDQLGDALMRVLAESELTLIGLGPERMELDARIGLAGLFGLLARQPAFLVTALRAADGTTPSIEALATHKARAEIGQSLELARQTFFARYLLELHRADPTNLDLVAFTRDAYQRWHPMPRDDGHHLFAQVPQFVQMRAGFAVLMWREALARDLLPSLVVEGEPSPRAFMALRNQVLRSLGAVDPGTSLATFLGRNLDFRDFFAALDRLSPPAAESPPPTPRVTPVPVRRDEPLETASCDASEIRAAMARFAPRFRMCYEKRLAIDRQLAGKVTLSWSIVARGDQGRASNARVTSNSTGDTELGACLLAILQGATFPTPRGGPCDVSYPFNFAASN